MKCVSYKAAIGPEIAKRGNLLGDSFVQAQNKRVLSGFCEVKSLVLPGHTIPVPASWPVECGASRCRCVMSFSFLEFSLVLYDN